MRLSLRLTLALVSVAVVPLAIAGVLWVDVGRSALEEQVRAAQGTAAERVSDVSTQWLRDTLAGMQLAADTFRLHRMDEQALVGALRAIYLQVEEASVVALFNSTGGLVTAPVFRSDAEVEGERLPADEVEVERFLENAPIAAILESGRVLVVGDPYLDTRRHAMMVPVAVAVEGAGLQAQWVLAAELSLRPVQELVGRVPMDSVGTAYIIDDAARILAHPDGGKLSSSALGFQDILARDEAVTEVHTLERDGGEQVLVAVAVLDGVPWVSIVEQPTATAFAAVREMVQRTAAVLGFSLAIALTIGVVLARGISRPITRASAGARAIAGGDLSGRLAESGSGEVRDLAVSFNMMASELESSRARIEEFNRELQQRVEERTAELKKAQAELLQSRKMAAIGELGAGVAHELNNPMTGILGMTQLMLRKRDAEDSETRLLRRIEEDAKRCREITMNLLRFSEQREEAALAEADLNEIAGSALDLQLSFLRSKGIEVEKDFDDAVPKVRADRAQLQQALLNILSNAGNATPEGGRVRVETRTEAVFALVRVADTGRGIPKENIDRILEPFFTTKEDWRGAGLGLSVAYKIVQSHNGTLEVDSDVGEGSTFTIRLPLPVGR